MAEGSGIFISEMKKQLFMHDRQSNIAHETGVTFHICKLFYLPNFFIWLTQWKGRYKIQVNNKIHDEGY